jgi:tRNA threonylcarbamoyl adenosine modification protein YeaZ
MLIMRSPQQESLETQQKVQTGAASAMINNGGRIEGMAGRPSARYLDWGIVLVLALDTSTPRITAGVVELRRPHELIEAPAGDPAEPLTVLAEHTADDPFAHAELLMPLAHAALAEVDRRPADLDAVVVGLGPGPFTGLRVGIVTAAALGDGLGAPVYGVPSHDALAAAMETDRPFLVVTDARRREVYVSEYAARARVRGPEVLRPADVRTEAGAVAGAAAGLVADLGLELLSPTRLLSAGLVTTAAPGLLTGAVPGPLIPLYLRRPDAVPPRPRAALR